MTEERIFENIMTISHKPQANNPTKGFSIAYLQHNGDGNLQGAVAVAKFTHGPVELTLATQVDRVWTGLKALTLDQQHRLE